MKKSLAPLFLSFTIACSAWAEKYEFVILKMTNSSENSTTGYDHGDSVELESGDVAKVVAVNGSSADYIILWDGEDYLEYDTKYSFQPSPNLIVGPGTLFIADRYAGSAESVTIAIQRASDTGSTTLAWNGTEWEGSSDGSQQANNDSSGGIDPTSIKYDELLGWTWLTDTNWVYSYTNLSWYYMHSVDGDIYVWNANLPNNGWQKLERG